MKKIGLFIVIAFALILSNCDSGEPMPASGPGLALTIRATGNDGFSVASAGRNANGWHSFSDSIVFTEAMLGVSRVKLEIADSADMKDGKCGDGNDGEDEDGDDNSGPGGRIANGGHDHDDDDDDKDEVVIEGEFIVDLIAGTSTPDMGFDSLSNGLIKEAEIKVGPILPDSNSVFLAFNVFKDTTSQMVEFSTSKIFEVEIEKKHEIMAGDNPLGQMLVLLHLEKLLGKIDFSRAEADEDGVIRINDESNWMLFNLVKSRFNSSFEVGKDRDHDGDIDD